MKRIDPLISNKNFALRTLENAIYDLAKQPHDEMCNICDAIDILHKAQKEARLA